MCKAWALLRGTAVNHTDKIPTLWEFTFLWRETNDPQINKIIMGYDKFSKDELKRDTVGQDILERVVQDGFSFELRLEKHAKCWGKHCRKREQQAHGHETGKEQCICRLAGGPGDWKEGRR